MKIKSIIGGAALALALVTSAQADATINITGATAFRAAMGDVFVVTPSRTNRRNSRTMAGSDPPCEPASGFSR